MLAFGPLLNFSQYARLCVQTIADESAAHA